MEWTTLIQARTSCTPHPRTYMRSTRQVRLVPTKIHNIGRAVKIHFTASIFSCGTCLHNTSILSLDHFVGPAGRGWAMFFGVCSACASASIRPKLLPSATGAHNIFSDSRGVTADSRRITTAVVNGALLHAACVGLIEN